MDREIILLFKVYYTAYVAANNEKQGFGCQSEGERAWRGEAAGASGTSEQVHHTSYLLHPHQVPPCQGGAAHLL